ncbi:unnamed protein product [Urochloa humidicola]
MRRLKVRPWFSLPQLVAVSTTRAPASCSSKGSPFGCSGRAGDILLPVPVTILVDFTAHCPGFCRIKNESGHVCN